NSLKHAFPGGRSGEVSVLLHSTGKDKFELVVDDDGVGMSQHRDFRSVETLGMHLIILMAEDQLRGTIELDITDGTKFKVTFEG
ncbi:MAG: histidine kinase, partial [Methanosarcinales archaeon]|nr:histidine kinase [Methanosarcinales archaeon]